MDDGEYSQAITPDEEKYDYDEGEQITIPEKNSNLGTARNKSYNYEDALKLRFPEHRKYVDSHNYVPSKAAPIYERPLPTNRPLTNRFRRFEDSAYQQSKPSAFNYQHGRNEELCFKRGERGMFERGDQEDASSQYRQQRFNDKNDVTFSEAGGTSNGYSGVGRSIGASDRMHYGESSPTQRPREGNLITDRREIEAILESVNSGLYNDDPLPA
ncbi:hypothetical protein ACOME3_008384 [Neoechinorhynchus agilis]